MLHLKQSNKDLQFKLAVEAMGQAIENVGNKHDLKIELDGVSMKFNCKATEYLYETDILLTMFYVKDTPILAKREVYRALNQ